MVDLNCESNTHPHKLCISLKLPTGSIIALKESVMEVVILVWLEVVLPAAVRGCWTDQEMNPIPPKKLFLNNLNATFLVHEGKRCRVNQERRAEAAEVVEMLDGMHTQSGERLNVGVPVVEAVDVLVHGGDVDKSKAWQFIKID